MQAEMCKLHRTTNERYVKFVWMWGERKIAL